jgi:hypothetical protein
VDKAWIAYALKTYLGEECENLDVSARYNFDFDEGRLSAVCVSYSNEAQEQEHIARPHVLFTKEIPASLVVQPEEAQGEKQLLTDYFNDSAQYAVYDPLDFQKTIPAVLGESGALLLERLKDEQHLKKLQKLTIH